MASKKPGLDWFCCGRREDELEHDVKHMYSNHRALCRIFIILPKAQQQRTVACSSVYRTPYYIGQIFTGPSPSRSQPNLSRHLTSFHDDGRCETSSRYQVFKPHLILTKFQAASITLQQAQTNALTTLLNLNSPVESTNPGTTKPAASGFKTPPVTAPPVWKILILDQQTQDVLATVLRVQDLRDIGVTLHVYVSRL